MSSKQNCQFEQKSVPGLMLPVLCLEPRFWFAFLFVCFVVSLFCSVFKMLVTAEYHFLGWEMTLYEVLFISESACILPT